MSRAAFMGAALLVWTRRRVLIVFSAVTVLAIFTVGNVAGHPRILPATILLRLSALFLPLLLFASAESAATLDLARAESHFPQPFMGLPLTAPQMVRPFMLGAALLSLALWLPTIDLSLEWKPQVLLPCLTLSLIVWALALIWTPFRRRSIRAWILTLLVLSHVALYLLTASPRVADEPVLLLGVLQLPLAYATAVRGVLKARQGEPRLAAAADRQARRRRNVPGAPFPSPLAALSWFEWQAYRERSKSLAPLLMTLLVSVALLGSLATASRGGAVDFGALLSGAAGIFAVMFITGLVSVTSCAAFQSTVAWSRNDAYAMPSFFAALPSSTGDLAWAKLMCAARGIVILWGFLALAAAALSLVFGIRTPWVALFTSLQQQWGAYQAAAILALAPLCAMTLAVAGGVSFAWVSLLGRGWKITSATVTVACCLSVLAPGWLNRHPAALAQLSHAVPAALAVLAAVKIAALVWLTYLVWARGLYCVARLSWIAGCWIAAVTIASAFCLRYFGHHSTGDSTLVCGLIVTAPVLGILGAPLALQLNRCR